MARARGTLKKRESWWGVRAVEGPEGLGEGLGTQEVSWKDLPPLPGNGGKYSFSLVGYSWGPVCCCSPSPLPLSTWPSMSQALPAQGMPW